jgi:protein SCO1
LLADLEVKVNFIGAKQKAAGNVLVVIFLLCCQLLASCQAHKDTRKYALEGSVLRKDPASQQITIHHGDIPGFMPAMTMDYKVQNLADYRQIEAGDKVKADLFVRSEGANLDYWLANIQITDRSQRGLVVEGSPHVLGAGEPIPDVPLVNQDGKTIHLSQFKGRAVLVTFIYTRCPLPTFCPRITSQFAAIHDALKKDTQALGKAHLISISFDPEYDKPDVLRRYGLTYIGDSAGFQTWDFATPSAEDLKKLAFAFGLQYYPDGNLITHSMATFLIAPDGTLAQEWPDNDWKTADVLQALKSEIQATQGHPARGGR